MSRADGCRTQERFPGTDVPRGETMTQNPPQRADALTGEQVPTNRTSDAGAERDADERADIREDRRTTQDLDDGEMGGEG